MDRFCRHKRCLGISKLASYLHTQIKEFRWEQGSHRHGGVSARQGEVKLRVKVKKNRVTLRLACVLCSKSSIVFSGKQLRLSGRDLEGGTIWERSNTLSTALQSNLLIQSLAADLQQYKNTL